MYRIVFSQRTMLAICAGVSLFMLAGCGGSGPSRRELTGTVTYDGKPVPSGEIHFNPDSSKGAEGPQGIAEIRDGKYKTNDGFGTVVGAHVVIVDAFSDPPPQKGEMPKMNYLARQYTTKVDIKSSGPVNIDIPKQSAK